MHKLYVGCSLTHASEEYKKTIDELKIELRKNYEVLDFIGLVGGTEREVFINDTNCIKNCDLFVADCSHPAIGLGYEIGLALTLNKPILAVAKSDAKVSRLVLGIDHPLFTFAKYQEMPEVLELVHKKLAYIKNLK